MNQFKEKIKNGEALLGTFIELNNPAIAQIAGLAGYDFVILDGEHGEIAVEDAANLARAAKLAGTAAISIPMIRPSLEKCSIQVLTV